MKNAVDPDSQPSRFPLVEAASDHALLVTFGEVVDVRLHAAVRRLFVSLQTLPGRGVTNLHPAYASLLIDFDPLQIGTEELSTEVRARLAGEPGREPAPGRVVEVPVCYGGARGVDLEAVAAHCGLTPQQVVERHAAREYLVYFLGFSPGFPYLGDLDPALATPRLPSPRKLVPAGSVGIGGAQTGIYPTASPGGWRIIGQTPYRLFDPLRHPPALLEIGDRVRFRPISEREFGGAA